jgi:hypothetical protein
MNRDCVDCRARGAKSMAPFLPKAKGWVREWRGWLCPACVQTRRERKAQEDAAFPAKDRDARKTSPMTCAAGNCGGQRGVKGDEFHVDYDCVTRWAAVEGAFQFSRVPLRPGAVDAAAGLGPVYCRRPIGEVRESHIESPTGLDLPVAVELWEEHPIGAGIKGYCINIYYPDNAEGEQWIEDVIKPLLYKFSMGTWDLNRLTFPNWSRVEGHLKQRLALRRGEAGSVTERR